MRYVRKPRVMAEVRFALISPYRPQERQVVLRRERVVRLPLVWAAKGIAVLAAVAMFMFGMAAAPTGGQTTLAAANDEERAQLEAQLKELEGQIAEYESTIDKYRAQGATLSSEVKALEAKVARINLQIRATNLSLTKLNNDIVVTTGKISDTETSITENRRRLGEILQSIYETEETGLIEIMLKNPKLSDFVSDFNNVILVQDGLRVTLQKITDLRNDLVDQKETLALEKADKEALKTYQDSQKKTAAQTASQKDELLKITKGQESRYKELLNETKKTAAEIRSRIFRLLGGGELTFEAAYELAKVAANATGIRAAFILAVLDQESALGRNVGSCTYQTAMHPTRDIPPFLTITSELGIDPNSVKVSCPITAHGAYGGAMGPAQFIPSTWALYKEGIARVTGSRPPNPWNNQDAFVATALYLKDSYNSSACVNYGQTYKNVLPEKTLRERCAAAQYYSGGRWFTYRFVYGDPVVERAERFQEDIDVLTS